MSNGLMTQIAKWNLIHMNWQKEELRWIWRTKARVLLNWKMMRCNYQRDGLNCSLIITWHLKESYGVDTQQVMKMNYKLRDQMITICIREPNNSLKRVWNSKLLRINIMRLWLSTDLLISIKSGRDKKKIIVIK